MRVSHIACAVAGAMALHFGAAMAAPVTVKAEFLYFQTLAVLPNPAFQQEQLPKVNGVVLQPDLTLGTVVKDGTTWAQARTDFTTPVQKVEFVYELIPPIAGFTPRANIIEFIDNTAPVEVGGIVPTHPFKLGTLRYLNGQWFPGASIGLKLTTSSSDPALSGQVFQGRIELDVNQSDVGDPFEEADFFFVTDVQGNPLEDLGSVRVFDFNFCPPGGSAPACNDGSADLNGFIASLHPSQFSNPAGGAFLSDSIRPGGPTPVPAPAPLALFAAAALAAAWIRRRH